MWIEEKERDKIQRKLNRFLKKEVDEDMNYRFLVEELIEVLDRKLAFLLIALLEGYNGCEIAACLGVSSSTITQMKKRLGKIVKKLVKS